MDGIAGEGKQEFFMRVKIVVDELQMKREQELCLGYDDTTRQTNEIEFVI